MRRYQLVVGAGEAGLRLDRYLARHLPASISRAMIQRGIRDRTITLGSLAITAHGKVRTGDTVTAAFSDLPARSCSVDLQAQELPLEVVYEDDALLVVNKPAGMVTHPAPGNWDSTLVNAILWHLRHAECGVRNAEHAALSRAGIVHRLDKDTSGLLLVAKTERAHAVLAKQMKARTIRRRYLAVVEGLVPLDTGTVNVPIGRHLTQRKQMTVRHLGGRSAVTHYRVLARRRQPLPYSALEVSLETGRTHQIRVHLAHLGYPVLGDLTYGKRPASFWIGQGITRQLLHAYRLSFQHPLTRATLTLTAPVPSDMTPWVGQGVVSD